jgi:hypothetical protein
MEVEHRIFLSAQIKLAAITQDAEQLARQGLSVTLIAHFRGSLSGMQEAIRSAGLSPYLFQTPFDRDALGDALAASTPHLALAMASLLPGRPRALPDPATPHSLAWLVSEHHPTHAADDSILAASRLFPNSLFVRFYDSLDSALFQRHGAKQVQALWATLGLQDDQFLSHHVIESTIREAQKRISRKAKSSLAANSIEEWFVLNLP